MSSDIDSEIHSKNCNINLYNDQNTDFTYFANINKFFFNPDKFTDLIVKKMTIKDGDNIDGIIFSDLYPYDMWKTPIFVPIIKYSFIDDNIIHCNEKNCKNKSIKLEPSRFLNGCFCGHNCKYREFDKNSEKIHMMKSKITSKIKPIKIKLKHICENPKP
jgi:hypothetical protein